MVGLWQIMMSEKRSCTRCQTPAGDSRALRRAYSISTAAACFKINKINQKIKNFTVILSCCFALFFTGCAEKTRTYFIDENAPPPAQVAEVTWSPFAGGVYLQYKLPLDKNLLYVRAEYEIRPGVMREVKSSDFKDYLILDGFGNMQTYDVKLYSVGKNEKASEPLIITVTPALSPVMTTKKSLRETSGGVAIDFENNDARAPLAIVLMADTANLGYMNEICTYYTSMPRGSFAYRGENGLDAVPYEFAVYIRDRWNNVSDTTKGTVTPWFEEYIAKPWIEYNLPNDIPSIGNDYRLEKIWDEEWNTADGFHGLDVDETNRLPHTITWDFGKVVKLSRMKYWPRGGGDDRWKRGHARVFEIWGTATPPDPTGSMKGWIPLGQFECVKPSGSGLQITAEDIALAMAGIDFDFVVSDFAPKPYTPVRYIRWRTMSTFANTAYSTIHILELSFWGEIININN